MKKLALLLWLCLFIAPSAFAGKEEDTVVVQDASGVWAYERVMSVPGVSQAELFGRARKWVLANVETADQNTALDDKEYTIVTTASIPLKPNNGWSITAITLSFKMHIDVRDGRYKYRNDNIIAYITGIGTVRQQPYSELARQRDKIDRYIRREALAAILKTSEEVYKSLSGAAGSKDKW